MALPPTSNGSIGFLSVEGETIPELREWQDAQIRIDVPPQDWLAYRLYLNGESLRLTQDQSGRVLAPWTRRGAGAYHIELRRKSTDGTEATVASRDTLVWPAKLSPKRFRTLLSDLESQLPAKVAISCQRLGGLAGVQILPPDQVTVGQELARLRRSVYGVSRRGGLPAALDTIGLDPYKRLASRCFWTTAKRSRRPDPSKLHEAVARPNNIDSQRTPLEVIDIRVSHTFDVNENRILKSYVYEVEARLRRLDRALTGGGESDVSTRENSTEVREMTTLLTSAHRSAEFLADVGRPAGGPIPITMVLAKKRGYRDVLQGILELRHSLGVRLDEPAVNAPLQNVPSLYQLWAVLSVIESLLRYGVERGLIQTQSAFITRKPGELFVKVLAGGVVAVVLERPDKLLRIIVTPQRAYTSQGSLRSITNPQIPDLSVEIQTAGSQPRLLIFDAKYKFRSEADGSFSLKPKPDDINRMHAYSHAIRSESGEFVVQYAAILYPGPPVEFDTREIEALPALPLDPAVTAPASDPFQVRLRELWLEYIPT